MSRSLRPDCPGSLEGVGGAWKATKKFKYLPHHRRRRRRRNHFRLYRPMGCVHTSIRRVNGMIHTFGIKYLRVRNRPVPRALAGQDGDGFLPSSLWRRAVASVSALDVFLRLTRHIPKPASQLEESRAER